VHDPWVWDDQALVVHVRDKGLLVLWGCGHAGVVNIVHYARKLTGVGRIYGFVGGMHLTGALFEPIIAPTIDELTQMGIGRLVPGHCSGWKAMQELARRFYPTPMSRRARRSFSSTRRVKVRSGTRGRAGRRAGAARPIDNADADLGLRLAPLRVGQAKSTTAAVRTGRPCRESPFAALQAAIYEAFTPAARCLGHASSQRPASHSRSRSSEIRS
jgi:hypothetical protein